MQLCLLIKDRCLPYAYSIYEVVFFLNHPKDVSEVPHDVWPGVSQSVLLCNVSVNITLLHLKEDKSQPPLQ